MSETIDVRLQSILSEMKNLNGFADRIGVQRTTLHRVKRGESRAGNLPIDTFAAIANGLGMTVDELYYGVPPALPAVYRRYAALSSSGKKLVDDALELAEFRATLKDEQDQTVQGMAG